MSRMSAGWFPWVLITWAAILVCDAAVAADAKSVFPASFDDAAAAISEGANPRTSNFLDEGRGKSKKSMMRMIMAIKMLLVSILVPKVIGLALFASWKGITISLIAFTIACMAVKWSASSHENSKKSIQLLIKKQDHGGENHHHEHWWRKIREAEPVYYEEPNYQGPYHGWEED